MNLVDRDRRLAVVAPAALGDPGIVLPDMARWRRDDRGGARGRLGPLSLGVGLQRQQRTVRANELVFIELAGHKAGHEDLPEPALLALAHRHAPAVPTVEIADDADPAGVGRPYRKGNARDPVMHDSMSAELLVAGEMVALDQEMQVEFAEHRGKPVDVVKLMPVFAPARPQAIAERLTPPRHGGDKQTGRVNPLSLGNERAARAVDDRHRRGVGQESTHAQPTLGLVHAEKGKRVGVACRDNRRDRRISPPRHRPAPGRRWRAVHPLPRCGRGLLRRVLCASSASFAVSGLFFYSTTSTRNGPGVATPSAKRRLNPSISVTRAPGTPRLFARPTQSISGRPRSSMSSAFRPGLPAPTLASSPFRIW